MIKKIQSDGYEIQVGDLLKSSFDHFLNEEYQKAKKVIVVDENTHEHCLSYLTTNFKSLNGAEIILIPDGEENKVMEICVQVWEAFMKYDINRNDLVINLGGGMITDIGGFIASVYKRGVDFINIPTSLLGMVDASTGGKTGIDFNGYKNLIGTFTNPVLVVVDPIFLKTLPDVDFISGKAEVLKHGIITSRAHWNTIKTITPTSITEDDILHSIEIKNNLVLKDCKEKNIRKKLNTGHTIGHALESFLLLREKESHGVCVAWGLLTEAYLSLQVFFSLVTMGTWSIFWIRPAIRISAKTHIGR